MTCSCCLLPSQLCCCLEAWLMAPGLLVPGPLSLGGCTGQEEACTSSCHGSIAVILATTFAEMVTSASQQTC